MPQPRPLSQKSFRPLRLLFLVFFASGVGLLVAFGWTRWQPSTVLRPRQAAQVAAANPAPNSIRRLEPTYDDQLHEDGWNLADGATYRLERKKYVELDKMAAGLRRPEAKFSEGSWMILRFYEGLSISQGESDQKWQDHLKTLQAWRLADPQSITAVLANAYAMIEYAEKARLNPPSYKRLPGAAEVEAARLVQAAAMLDALHDRRQQCPAWYAYARVVIHQMKDANFHPFEWPISRERVNRGADAMCRKFPQALSHQTERCLLACVLGDHTAARAAFKELGSRVDFSLWFSFERFRAARDWAYSEDPEPFSFEKFEAREREKNAEQKKEEEQQEAPTPPSQKFITATWQSSLIRAS